jgi:tetratricopeptide (TPR) repeat protein
MRRSFFVVAVLLSLATSVPLPAAQESMPRAKEPQATLDNGVQQVQRASFEEGAAVLEQIVKGLADDTQHRAPRARAHLYLGVAYLGLKQEAAAREHFGRALALDPASTLDDPAVAAPAKALFRQLQAERTGTPGALARVRSDRPKPAPTVGLTFANTNQGSGGVKVLHVAAGGPAAAAGLRAGDVVVAVDGVRVSAAPPVIEALADGAVGETVRLEVMRGDRLVPATVRRAERDAVLEAACAAGDGVSCLAAAEMFTRAEDVAKDAGRGRELTARALPHLQASCTSGAAYACYRLAGLLEQGAGVEKDPAAARAAYRKACDAGVADACAPARPKTP